MNFASYLTQQLSLHRAFAPQDIVKLCYQAAYGAEHLLNDLNAAKNYFLEEYAATPAKEMPLYEPISEDICRVNLAAWKKAQLPPQWLFQMFTASASVPSGSRELFLQYLDTAEELLHSGLNPFPLSDWQTYIDHYKKGAMTAVHHSPQYRQANAPAYRIVNRQLTRLLPILQAISARPVKKAPFLIAIDGQAASGKSTMAEQLSHILGADIIHMDDFFLPMELRTEKRFQTPGSNVHYERFAQEILPYVSKPQDFSYRRFDCSKMDYGEKKPISSRDFRIVEGSYSCHPAFGSYADLTVFSGIDAAAQMERILLRNGAQMAEMFRTRWIPLEEDYFRACRIKEKADIAL